MISAIHTNLPSSHSINHLLLLLLLCVKHGVRRVLLLTCNHPSLQFTMPVTCISLNQQHSKPQAKKHESEKRKKRFLRIVEEYNSWGIACRKDIKQGKISNFSAKWGNLFKHFLLKSCVKLIKMRVYFFFFNQTWALLKDTIRPKSSLLVGHCLFIQVAESWRYLQLRCGQVSCMRRRSPIFEY